MERQTLIGVLVCLCAVTPVQSQFFGNVGSLSGLNSGRNQIFGRNNGLGVSSIGGLGVQSGNNQFGQRNTGGFGRLGNQFGRQGAINARNNEAAQQFNNVDFANNVQQGDRTVLNFENENYLNEGTAFSSNNGAAFGRDNQLQAIDNVAQSNFADAGFSDNEAFAANNQFGLLDQQQDGLAFTSNLFGQNNAFANGIDQFGVLPIGFKKRK